MQRVGTRLPQKSHGSLGARIRQQAVNLVTPSAPAERDLQASIATCGGGCLLRRLGWA
jgi:hypothetical protein